MSPPALDHVVRMCLEKLPADRWQTAHDLMLQLRWVAEGGSQVGLPAPLASKRKLQERLAWSLALVMSVAFFVALMPTLKRLYTPEAQPQE